MGVVKDIFEDTIITNFMKKTVFRKLTVAFVVVSLLAGCQEEGLNPSGVTTNAICTNCGGGSDPVPPPPPPPSCQGKTDMIITSVVRGGLPTQDTPYTVTVKNIGLATANLNHVTNRLGFQGWFSNDGVTHLAPACGTYFYQTIAPGESVSESIGCTGANYDAYTYLIVELQPQNPSLLNECNVNNNRFVARLH